MFYGMKIFTKEYWKEIHKELILVAKELIYDIAHLEDIFCEWADNFCKRRSSMSICSHCLHKEVCAYRKQTIHDGVNLCEDFLGRAKVQDERPALYDDIFMLDHIGLPFIGYYTNFNNKERFTNIDTLQIMESTSEFPSYWLKGLDIYGQSMVARKEAESVLQAVSDANES
mgnify:CR=1 FL=1